MKKILKPAIGLLIAATAACAHADMKADDIKAARGLFTAYGCANCHEMSDKATGPALKEIAKRYKGKNVTAELATRIREGSSGRWGDLPHPPVAVTPAEATLMARWVLAGAPGG